MSAADDLRALSAAATPGPWEAPFGILSLKGDWPATPEDIVLIMWCRNHADALTDLADTVKAIPRHYPYGGPEVEDVTGKCLVCGTSWPCPTERAHRALDALEANRG